MTQTHLIETMSLSRLVEGTATASDVEAYKVWLMRHVMDGSLPARTMDAQLAWARGQMLPRT